MEDKDLALRMATQLAGVPRPARSPQDDGASQAIVRRRDLLYLPTLTSRLRF